MEQHKYLPLPLYLESFFKHKFEPYKDKLIVTKRIETSSIGFFSESKDGLDISAGNGILFNENYMPGGVDYFLSNDGDEIWLYANNLFNKIINISVYINQKEIANFNLSFHQFIRVKINDKAFNLKMYRDNSLEVNINVNENELNKMHENNFINWLY